MPQLVDLDSLVRVGDSKVAMQSTDSPGPDPSRRRTSPPSPSRSPSRTSTGQSAAASTTSCSTATTPPGHHQPKSHLHHHQSQPAADPPPPRGSAGTSRRRPRPRIGLPNKIQHSGTWVAARRRAQVRISLKRGGRFGSRGRRKFPASVGSHSQRERRGSPRVGVLGESFWVLSAAEREEDEEATAVRNERNFPGRERRTEVARTAEPPGWGDEEVRLSRAEAGVVGW
ncbi:uncharacterized protein A4U43_C09F560 [Asparagus officinalis]|uniref:Uncharacterized protein n=1 Tax=Asparagus officinalis TaxID=4686 RepID=A0A5P1E454_ASPOF|nr:uncharacterized protein A4U43_C09F560 [Asparagus officinalis]